MRNILIVLVVLGLMTTVGVYAASITGTAKTIGGTGDVTVSAPATAATVSWTTDASGMVTGASVTWTPAVSANYTIKVIVGSSSGSLPIVTSGVISRTDLVTITPSVSADLVSTAKVIISQD